MTTPRPTTQMLQDLINRVDQERDNILEYWSTVALDPNGGFYGRVTHDNRVEPYEKRAIINARALWTFSTALRLTGESRWRQPADHAYAFLERFWDDAQGGVYWSVDKDGNPLDTRKQIYAQAFALYGWAAYYNATGNQAALDRAKLLFRLVVDKSTDNEHGGYFEAFDRDWVMLEHPAMNPPWDLDSPKRTNTHLHLLEGFSELLLAWDDPQVRSRQADLVRLFAERIDDGQGHLKEYMTIDFVKDSPTISYGHDIEAAWLLHQAAAVLKDPSVTEVAHAEVLRLAEVSYAEGRDPDGSIYHEMNYGHKPGKLDPDRHWWPQAEGTVGYLAAFQVSGEPKFFRAFTQLWEFIEQHLVDRRYGEWLIQVSAVQNQDGSTSYLPPVPSYKVSEWKCPYHNARACMELGLRLRALQSAE